MKWEDGKEKRVATRQTPLPITIGAIGIALLVIGIFWWPLLVTGFAVIGIAGYIEIREIWLNIPKDLQSFDEQLTREAKNERMSSNSRHKKTTPEEKERIAEETLEKEFQENLLKKQNEWRESFKKKE